MLREIGGVAVDEQARVTDVVRNDGVGMGRAIVQEMGDGFGSRLCSLCLGGCKGAYGDEEG